MKIPIVIAALALASPMAARGQDATQTLLNAWRVVSGNIVPNNSNNGVKVGTSTPFQIAKTGSTTIPTLTLSGITGSTQCLHVNALGQVSGTAADCGAGGSGGNSAWTIGNGLIYNSTSTDSVLIGTSTPTSATVFLQGSGTKTPLDVASSTGTSIFTVFANGKIGFGTTTTPDSQVTIEGGNTPGSFGSLAISRTGNNPNIVFKLDGANVGQIRGYADGFRFTNLNGSVARLIMDTVAGNVGVNKVSPTSNLWVQASSSASTVPVLTAASTSGDTLFNVLANGNVGVNTSTPAYKLDVYGTGINGTCCLRVKNTSSGAQESADVRVENNLGYRSSFFKLGSGYGTYKTIVSNDLGFYNDTNPGNITFLNDYSLGKILLTAGSASTAHLAINSTGFVGIATTTPAGVFQVHQDASSTVSSTFYTQTAPILQLGQKNLTSPSANGNYLAVNSPSTFTGNYIDIQNNGSSQFKVTSAGTLTSTNGTIGGVSMYSYGVANNFGIGNGGGAGSTISYTSSNGDATDAGSWQHNSVGIAMGYTPSTALVETSYTGLKVGSLITPSNGNGTITGRWVGLMVAPTMGNGKQGYNTVSSTPYLTGLAVEPIINVRATSTAGYVALHVNPTETKVSTTGGVVNYLAMFRTSSSTKVVITSEGKVGIGSATPNFYLESQGTVAFPGATLVGVDQTYYGCGAAGTFEFVWNTASCITSAARFKKNIVDLDLGINEFMKLRPVWYEKKDPLDKTDAGQQPGFVADEVEKIDKRLVTYDKNGIIRGFRYEQFTAWLAKVVQDIEKQVIGIIAKNNEQDGKIRALETKLDKQQAEIDLLKKQLNLLVKEKGK